MGGLLWFSLLWVGFLGYVVGLSFWERLFGSFCVLLRVAVCVFFGCLFCLLVYVRVVLR